MPSTKMTKTQLRKELARIQQKVEELELTVNRHKVLRNSYLSKAEKFEVIFQNSLDILAVLDTQSNKVLHISDQVQNMLGHRAENLIGKPFPILFPEEEERTRQERLQEFRNFDTVFSDQPFLNADGSVVLMDLTATLIPWDDSNAILVTLRGTEERRQAEARQTKLIAELQEALETVEVLSGFLPICVHCKKIRDDEGYWNQIEEYIRDHSDADFSHSICPECLQKYYSEFDDDE